MTAKNLAEAIAAAGGPVEMLRHSQAGPNVYPGVPSEYTNWRDEQYAWQHTCVLYNQSYHMADLAVENLLAGLQGRPMLACANPEVSPAAEGVGPARD